MKTLVCSGKNVEVPTPAAGYTSGQPVVLNKLVGICVNTYNEGDTAIVTLDGAHIVPKAAGAAWAVGEILYWDDTNKVFTKTSGSNAQAGYVYAPAASADASGIILLRQ